MTESQNVAQDFAALAREYVPRHARSPRVPVSREASDNAEPETVRAHIARVPSPDCRNAECHGCATRRAWHMSRISRDWWQTQVTATEGELGHGPYWHRDQNDDS